MTPTKIYFGSLCPTFHTNFGKRINAAWYKYMHNGRTQYFKGIKNTYLSSKCSLTITWGKKGLRKNPNPLQNHSTDLETYI